MSAAARLSGSTGAAVRAAVGWRGPRASRLAIGAARFCIVCAEVLIALSWVFGTGSAAQLFAAHAAAASVYGLAAAALRRNVGGRPLVEAAMIGLTGPLGLLTLVLEGGAGGAGAEDARLAQDDVMDAAERLDAAIRADRRPQRDPAARRSLIQRVESGDLAEQQRAITLISLLYVPGMHPALMAALRSTTPAVRVQAAAVFAKLRERFGSEARRLLSEGPGRADAAQADALAASPFVDAATASALRAIARAAFPEPGR